MFFVAVVVVAVAVVVFVLANIEREGTSTTAWTSS
jgi:hypothetical protein